MQALGSYKAAHALLAWVQISSAMIVDGILEPMELAHLPYKIRGTYEDYVGSRLNAWARRSARHVTDVVEQLKAALEAITSSSWRQRQAALKSSLPAPGSRQQQRLRGGFRLWRGATKCWEHAQTESNANRV